MRVHRGKLRLGKTADFGSMGDLVARVVFTNFIFCGVYEAKITLFTRAAIFSLADLTLPTCLIEWLGLRLL